MFNDNMRNSKVVRRLDFGQDMMEPIVLGREKIFFQVHRRKAMERSDRLVDILREEKSDAVGFDWEGKRTGHLVLPHHDVTSSSVYQNLFTWINNDSDAINLIRIGAPDLEILLKAAIDLKINVLEFYRELFNCLFFFNTKSGLTCLQRVVIMMMDFNLRDERRMNEIKTMFHSGTERVLLICQRIVSDVSRLTRVLEGHEARPTPPIHEASERKEATVETPTSGTQVPYDGSHHDLITYEEFQEERSKASKKTKTKK